MLLMNPNDYEKQRERAIKRKLELIKLKGGKCEKCGYSKNISALEFHHIDPSTKEFNLDERHLSNTTIEKILKESDKCILVCSNCHKEIHYPHLGENEIENLLLEFNTKSKKISDKKKKTSICKKCGKEFLYVKGKIYCSNECRIQDKNYPTKEEVLLKYDELKSWEKVADYFSLTRRIIQRIRK